MYCQMCDYLYDYQYLASLIIDYHVHTSYVPLLVNDFASLFYSNVYIIDSDHVYGIKT